MFSLCRNSASEAQVLRDISNKGYQDNNTKDVLVIQKLETYNKVRV